MFFFFINLLLKVIKSFISKHIIIIITIETIFLLLTDPYGKEVLTQISRQGALHQVIFTPLTVGQHSISVLYGRQAVVGSPGSCNVHNASHVRLIDVTQPGLVKQEMGFTGK